MTKINHVLILVLAVMFFVSPVYAGDYCVCTMKVRVSPTAPEETLTRCDKCATPTSGYACDKSTTYDDSTCSGVTTRKICCLYANVSLSTGSKRTGTYTCSCGSMVTDTGGKCKNVYGSGGLATSYGDNGRFIDDTTCGGHNGETFDPGGGSGGGSSEPISVSVHTEQLNAGTLRAINPLSRSTVFSDPKSRTPGNFISRLVKNIVFPAAGLLLFLYLVWGGFQIVQGGSLGNDNIVDSGKQRATAAVIGFLLLFGSYWMWSLVELTLGLGAA